MYGVLLYQLYAPQEFALHWIVLNPLLVMAGWFLLLRVSPPLTRASVPAKLATELKDALSLARRAQLRISAATKHVCEVAGTAEGSGMNINIGWNTKGYTKPGDAEYMAAWREILMPVRARCARSKRRLAA